MLICENFLICDEAEQPCEHAKLHTEETVQEECEQNLCKPIAGGEWLCFELEKLSIIKMSQRTHIKKRIIIAKLSKMRLLYD